MLTPYLGIRSIYDNNNQIHKFCFHIIRIDYNKEGLYHCGIQLFYDF